MVSSFEEGSSALSTWYKRFMDNEYDVTAEFTISKKFAPPSKY